VDPEPDMLRLAGVAAGHRGIGNATWILGADTDVPTLGALMGERSPALTVIGLALHWMQHKNSSALCRRCSAQAEVSR
jgi:hypothetical protein